MSILDGVSQEALLPSNKFLELITGVALEKMPLTRRQKTALRLVKDGKPLAIAANIPPPCLDAMLLRGSDLLKAGRIDEAREMLTLVTALFPMNPPALYALALTYQIVGQIEPAARLFLMFVALDATNPDGHLRLSECLIGAREYDKARDYLLAATQLCEKGHGTPASREHATRMTAYLEHHIAEHKS